jgi:signal transduction histidine kinase
LTELVATAISNADARAEAERLSDEQAALRRVATLVARGVPPAELFSAATEEAGTLVGADSAAMARADSDHSITLMATWGEAPALPEPGFRFSIEDGDLATTVLTTGRPARADGSIGLPPSLNDLSEKLGIQSSVASPIVVEGHVWGGLVVHSTHDEPLPPDTEARLQNFTELLATAVSNAHARDEVQRLADEQAALRRVATLVAQQAPSAAVFASIAEEVALLLGAQSALVLCYQPDGTAAVVAGWGEVAATMPVGTELAWSATDAIRAKLDELGLRSGAGSPVVVDGQLWGAIAIATAEHEPVPPDAESRIAQFTELAATAISNVQARADLAGSRARVVAAADEERRRVVRDLHDGAQQRLVHTVITLKLARRELERDPDVARPLVDEALAHAQSATAELRELVYGILPALLATGGLPAGVGALAARMSIPVDVGVTTDRLPTAVEAAAYFVVAEALTNVAKHSRAEHAEVTARVEDRTLQVQVRDDGVGGARPDGSGLLGLGDRLAVLDGSLRVESPTDGGTLIEATIPVMNDEVAGVRAGHPVS